MNFNQTILAGRITRDIETREAGEHAVYSFGLAVNRRRGKDKEDEVLFIDCEAWNKTGEIINKYHGKGDPIHLVGHLKLDQWEDKEGGKRQKIKLVVDSFQFLKKSDKDEEGGNGNGNKSKSSGKSNGKSGGKTTKKSPDTSVDDDDIPF